MTRKNTFYAYSSSNVLMFNQDLDFISGCRDTGAEVKKKPSNHSLKAKKKNELRDVGLKFGGHL